MENTRALASIWGYDNLFTVNECFQHSAPRGFGKSFGQREHTYIEERGLEKIYSFGSLSNVIGFIGLIVLSLSLSNVHAAPF